MNKIKLAILFTVFIDIVGVGIVIPVLPFYVESFGARPLVITLLFSVFALCSLISAPFLGTLSDRIGRRPVLIASIISTSIGWFVFAWAPSVLFLFIGRIIDGMAAGNITTAQNYLIDISKDKKERASNLGLIGASFGIGFIIGPFLGGVLSSVSTQFPFYFVGAMALLNAALAYFFLPETNKNKDRSKKMEFNPLRPIIRAARNARLRTNYIVWFLFLLGIASMQSIFALYVGKVFGFSAFITGLFFTISGVLTAFNQGVALKRFWLRHFKETDLEFWLLIANIVAFLLVSLGSLPLFVLGQFIMALAQPVLRVVMTSQVISNVPESAQGETMGILNSITSLAMIIAPLAAGTLFEVKYFLPFLMATFFSLGAFAVVYINRKRLGRLHHIEDKITSV